MNKKKIMIAGLVSLLLLSGSAQAQAGKIAPAYHASVPKPTLAEVRYGGHERHVLDFWKAPSDTPTPLAIAIHGNAWVGGSKEGMSKLVDFKALLKSGISVVSINYRLMRHSQRCRSARQSTLS